MTTERPTETDPNTHFMHYSTFQSNPDLQLTLISLPGSIGATKNARLENGARKCYWLICVVLHYPEKSNPLDTVQWKYQISIY